MGSSLSSKSNRGKNRQLLQNLSQMYHNKMYEKNKKSIAQFSIEIDSIIKRSAYLKYIWAKELLKQLMTIDKSQLYAQYQQTLVVNCQRDGRQEKVFCSSKIRIAFIKGLNIKFKDTNSIPTIIQLMESIQQCKYYFMVMNWLHKLVTLQTQCDESYENKENKKQCSDEIIYTMVLDLATKTFIKYIYKQTSRTKVALPEYSHSRQLITEVMALRKRECFCKKERSIAVIQQILKKVGDNDSNLIKFIQQIFGESKIFAHLLVIKEIGTEDVSFLWLKFCANKYPNIFT